MAEDLSARVDIEGTATGPAALVPVAAAGKDGARWWASVVLPAALAGLAAWGVGELTLDRLKPSSTASADPYAFSALNDQIARINSINGATSFGALGGLLGLALGVVGGWSRRSRSHALRGGLVGLILGALAGGMPSFALMPLQWKTRSDDTSMSSLIVPLLFHLGLWVGAGLAAGLAFGVGRFGWKSPRTIEAALAGLAGALVGTFVFEVAGALLFPFDFTSQPISTSPLTRLVARLTLAVFVALGVARLLSSTEKPGPVTAPLD